MNCFKQQQSSKVLVMNTFSFSLSRINLGGTERRILTLLAHAVETGVLVTQQIYVFSPHVMESKRVLDSGFRIPGTGFQSLSVDWNLDTN